jgi:hypothetical protein
MKWGEFHLQEIQFLQFIIPPLDESWGYIRDPYVRPSHFWFPDNN